MTREAIEYFKFHRKIFCEDHLKICPKDSIAYQATLKEKEFYDMAIKALEQGPILDKIKGQIEDYLHGVEIALEVLVENDPLRPKMEGAKDTLEECLELINKAESEG